MINHTTPERWDSTISDDEPTSPTGTEAVESCDIDSDAMFYNAESPLAWVETSGSMRLDDYT